MIDTSQQLAQHLESCIEKENTRICAIDTEADSLHRYRESLCLVQFCGGRECVLIDPLTIEDLQPLGDYLSTATVWMHGADYDMTMLKRQFGSLPETVYDTQIGARLLGVKKFGLGDLVQHYFDVTLSKSSQKADWGKRPLSEKMIEYALNDVVYLLEMGDKIVAELKEKQRHDWFVESCETALQKVSEREEGRDDAWRISGSGKLEPRGLAFLRSLWNWRDKEAESWDRPSFMVAPNRQLLEWSTDLAEKRKVALPPHFRPDRIKRFREAVASAETLPKNEWPDRPVVKRRKRDREFDNRVDALIARRNKIASELDIDGSLIASRSNLEQIAANESQPADLLMKWQLQLLDL